MKLILALTFLLAGAVNAFGQSTTVSGTVTDAGGQSWNNGTFTATFVPNPQYPVGPYTWTGGTLNTTISGTLSGTGTYSVSLPSNSAISPVGSQWQIQFVPNATSAPFLTANTPITGATQTLNATPPDISINLQNPPGPFTTAYADDEIATPIPQGAEYFNTTSLLTRVWNGSAWANQGAGGGGGTVTGTGVANQVAFWTGASAIGGNSALTFVPGTKSFLATGGASSVSGILSGPSALNQLAVQPSEVDINGGEVNTNLVSVFTRHIDITAGGHFIINQQGVGAGLGLNGQAITLQANPGDLVLNSSSANVGVTVGSANRFNFPTVTGIGGQFLQTNGANPQQLSWTTTSPISASPIMGYYLSSSCKDAGITNAFCFSTPADIQQANDCAWTSGQPDVTCNTAHFVSTDCVGGSGCTGTGTSKRAIAYFTCSAANNLSANSNNGPFTTSAALTIATFISSTHVTLSGNASVTVAQHAAGGGIGPGGCIVWGHPDDSGAAAMDTAMQAASQCPRAHLANSYYFFTTPHFATNPPACSALGVSGGVNAGNIVYPSGFELDGRGSGTTVIFIPPGFPETGTCTNGLSGIGCFVVPLQGRWSNLQITGGGNFLAAIPGNPAKINLVEMDGPASLDNFVCTNWGNSTSPTAIVGVAAYLWSQIYQINLSACGRAQLATNISSSVTIIKGWFENFGSYEGIGVGELTDYYTQNPLLFSKYHLICYDCTANLETTSGPGFAVVNRGGLRVKWYRGAMSTAGSPTQNGNVGYDCVTTAGCVFDVQDASIDFSVPAGDQNNIAINCTVACTNHIENTVFKGSATGGKDYSEVAGSKLFDMGSNTYSSPPLVTVNGAVVGPTNSARGTACATGNFALTSGWGTSSVASVASNGDIQGCHVSITGAAGAAGPVLTWTYPAAPIVAPGSCHLSGASGTLTGVGTGTPGATTVAYTFTGTPSAQTYNFDVGCP